MPAPSLVAVFLDYGFSPCGPTPDLFEALFDLSLTGSVLYDPVRDAAGEVVDFAFARLNPAAQRLLALPARPATTYLAQFPEARTNGGFALHRGTFGADEPGQFELSSQAEGNDQYVRVGARRVGQQLLVSFAAPADQPRPAAEAALRDSQAGQLGQELEAREQHTQQLAAWQAEVLAATRQQVQAVRAEAGRQWEQLFRRAPAAICIFDGPEWVYEFVNPGYQAMFPSRALLGKRLLDALPEVAGQPLMQILRHVYDTGQTFEGHAVLVPLARTAGGTAEDIYFDLCYIARYSDAGEIDGFITYAHDVTQQVLARREREQRQQELQQVFEQAPVGVYVMRMPHYVLDVVNEPMARLLGRPVEVLRGRPLFDSVPEGASQGQPELLDQVWRTQQPLALSEQPFYLAHHQPGEVGYFSCVYQPLLDAQGQMTVLVSSCCWI